MMGVSAVMGILSVVGVKAYTYAMNKHKANELIYEANKRATTIAMQIASGRNMNSLSIGEFTNPVGYIFGAEKNPHNENQFNITIDGVDTDICTQMKSAVGPTTVVRAIASNCGTITFNNDLSTTSYASDYNTDQTACTDSGYKYCPNGDDGVASKCQTDTTANCCVDVVYDAQCQACNATTGKPSNKNGTNCYIDNDITKPGTCNTGVCVDSTNGEACTSNADCGHGNYCKITYNTASDTGFDARKNANETQCYLSQYFTGTCTASQNPTRLTTEQKALLTNAGFSASTIIGPSVSWWSAKNWCESKGKQLLDVKTIGCYRRTTNQTTNNTLVEAGQAWAYCCKEGEACQQSSWDTSLWNGKNVLPGKAEEVAKFAEKMIALRKVYGAAYFWTKSPYGNISDNSYYAFSIGSKQGYVPSYTRHQNCYALCE